MLRRPTGRPLELLSEDVGITQNIEDRTATTVAAAKTSLMTDCAFRRMDTSGQTQDLTRLIGRLAMAELREFKHWIVRRSQPMTLVPLKDCSQEGAKGC